jgi:hypothetical protein
MPIANTGTFGFPKSLEKQADLQDRPVLVVFGARPVKQALRTDNPLAGGESPGGGMVDNCWTFDLSQHSIADISHELCAFLAPNYFNGKSRVAQEITGDAGGAKVIALPFMRATANIQGPVDLHYFKDGINNELTRSLFLSVEEGDNGSELRAMLDFLRELRPATAAGQKPSLRAV